MTATAKAAEILIAEAEPWTADLLVHWFVMFAPMHAFCASPTAKRRWPNANGACRIW